MKSQELSIKYGLLFAIVGLTLLHLACIQSDLLGIAVSLSEIILSFYLLIKRQYDTSIYAICIILATSYSSGGFFGSNFNKEIYTFENIPFLHGYPATLYFLLLSFLVISNPRNRHNQRTPIISFAKYTIYGGFIMGIVSVLYNGFQYRAWVTDIFQCLVPALMVLVITYVNDKNKDFSVKIKTIIFHLLLSYVIIAWLTILLNIYADLGGEREKVLMTPIPCFYIPSLILFIGLLRKRSDKIIVLAAYASSISFQFFFDSTMNGKSWFVFITSILAIIYSLSIKYWNRYRALSTVFIIASLVVVANALPKFFSFSEESENLKLKEFVSIHDAAESGDLDDMGMSSGFRFLEFINTAEQYIDQPLFALTGRGYGGSIHSNGYFVIRSDSYFTEDQYVNDKFYRLHESLNVIFLKHGIIGLVLLLYLIVLTIRGLPHSPWLYIGFIWLLFFWGFQTSLLSIGIPALILGYNEYKRKISNSQNRITSR